MLKENIRQDFPILQQSVRGKSLVFLDNSSTTQKPRPVIELLKVFYEQNNANTHRGVYELSARATKLYENTRARIQSFINAKHAHEIIFVSGATEAINLVAQSYGRAMLKAGDEIIISTMEHHSNIVPWQLVAEQHNLVLRVIPISDAGEIDIDSFKALLSSRTRLVAIAHASNVLGTINPIKQMIQMAHEHDAVVLVDGAQAFPHLAVDVQDLDCDFYVFSGHKAYGPTGVGVLYGKTDLLERMPPYQGGGSMISTVSFEKSTYADLPYKFEAGTPSIASVVGFNAAIEYLQALGMDNISQHEQDLLHYATAQLSEVPDLKIIGTAKEKLGVLSFVMGDIHPHDIGTILDHEGIAVRAGHHCAMPLMERFKVPATVRASLGVYNNKEDIDALKNGLLQVKRLFK